MSTQDVEVLIEGARGFIGAPAGNRRVGRDPVNQPMIHHWVQAFDDHNPIYVDAAFAAETRHGGIVAPPGMVQTWIMDGPEDPEPGPRSEVLDRLDAAGYTSVVATNYEHEYLRELRVGDRLTQQSSVEDLSDEKQTSLGIGRFVTMRHEYVDQDGDLVAIGRMRLLKFRPPSSNGQAEAPVDASADAPSGSDAATDLASNGQRARPAITRDNAFFWEGVAAGELRIQQCGACQVLRHPPRPMCDQCGSTETTHVVSRGRGRIHSRVVHHHPPLPGVRTPHPVVLVDLDEGTRFLSHMVDGTPLDQVQVGREVQLAFTRIDDDLVLPLFRLAEEGS